jgi:hypothetical protein
MTVGHERTAEIPDGVFLVGGRPTAVAAATFVVCLALAVTGCGASDRMPSLSWYRPPLKASPGALTYEPNAKAMLAARLALRGIQSTMRAPRVAGQAIRFGVLEYQLIVMNVGSPGSFVTDQTLAQDVTVMPDSSAIRRERVLASPTFVARIDRLHWEAAGRPPYANPEDHKGASSRLTIPAGGWSFTPHGTSVTVKRARELPKSSRALSREIRRLFGASSSAAAPAALILNQYGFLLASAPLTRATRRAALGAIAALPAVHLCDALFPGHGAHDLAVCVNGNPISSEILLDSDTGVAQVVCERLDNRTPLYPHMPVGSLVASDTFSLQPPTS